MSIWKYEEKPTNQRAINRNITKGLNLLEDLIKDTRLIEHHTKYLEIHGEDKTEFITRSEHTKTHYENKIRIPPEISRRAYERTEKRKEYLKNWRKNHPDYKKNHTNEWKDIIKNLENIEKCPLCGSNNTVKGGKHTYNGKRRFICKDCKKYFTGKYNFGNNSEKYLRCKEAIQYILPELREAIKKNGTIAIKISNLSNELGEEFKSLSETSIIWVIKHVLFHEGIWVKSGRHIDGDKLFVMTFVTYK
jgi:transposase-like protein